MRGRLDLAASGTQVVGGAEHLPCAATEGQRFVQGQFCVNY